MRCPDQKRYDRVRQIAHKTPGAPKNLHHPSLPSLVRATGVPDRLHLLSNLVGWERFFRVRGPMTKRKRGRILGVGPSKAEFFG